MGKDGQVDLAVALIYDNHPKTAYLIEVKFEKIEEDGFDSITAAHNRNTNKAKEQLAEYGWLEPNVDSIQKIAVSGVWHRRVSRRQVFELSIAYEFLS